MKYAPIVLFVYNRLNHTQQTIEALKGNELTNQSDLYIFSDAYKIFSQDPIKTKENMEKVQSVRDYIKTIDGFKKISIIEREKNYGLANSIIDGVTNIVNQYGKIIVLEDDLIASGYFLKYMNEALEFYKNEEEVISIHGYIFPLKGKVPDTFFIRGADCWGWATWKRGWDIFNSDSKQLLEELERRNLTREFDFNNSYPYTQMLKDQRDGKNNSWAIRWYASAFLNDKLTLYPGRSLVKNIGFDKNGTHCSYDKFNLFSVFLAQNPIRIGGISIQENKGVRKKINNYFSTSKRNKIMVSLLSEAKKQFVFILQLITPQIVIIIYNKIIRKIKSFIKNKRFGWFGNYQSWEEVCADCEGYNSDKIFEKCKQSLLMVKEGNAVYERDSVLFNKIQYSWPLLAGLMWISSQNTNRLNVIDFGGSLGSTYFQNRKFFKNLDFLKWNIVEQERFVEIGKKYFEDDNLNFFKTIDECVKFNKVQVIIFSGVIQYLENPYELLDSIFKYDIEYIIFDLTGFLNDNNEKDRITIQKVPPDIYEASYPCWFFNKENFLNFMNKQYSLIEEFESYIGNIIKIDNKIKAQYKGFIFQLKR